MTARVRRPEPPFEHATPTHVDPRRPIEQGAPTELTARPEPGEPVRVISMKDPAGGGKPRIDGPRVPLHVQLRSIAEVAGLPDPPSDLGRLAPPRDPREARARRRRGDLLWASVASSWRAGSRSRSGSSPAGDPASRGAER